jgi:hypothetical protein
MNRGERIGTEKDALRSTHLAADNRVSLQVAACNRLSFCLLSHQDDSAGTQATMAKEPTLEHSEFSGEFEDDGVTVLVDIFRPAGTQVDWQMEVVSQDDDVTSWDEPFATDRDAWEEFLATVERDGIRSFLEEPPASTH